jgi:hypothetical protein
MPGRGEWITCQRQNRERGLTDEGGASGVVWILFQRQTERGLTEEPGPGTMSQHPD